MKSEEWFVELSRNGSKKSQKSSSFFKAPTAAGQKVVIFPPRPPQTSKFMLFYCDEIISIMMMKGLFFVVLSPAPGHKATIFLICKFTQVFPLNIFLCFHFCYSFFTPSPLDTYFEKKSFWIVCCYIFTLEIHFLLPRHLNKHKFTPKDLSENE